MTKDKIIEQYASIKKETCEGYQYKHILAAMQKYADQQCLEQRIKCAEVVVNYLPTYDEILDNAILTAPKPDEE